MRLAHTLEARQQQTQRIDPRQILASEILAWTTPELESAVEREMAENPALETRDGEPLNLAGTWSANTPAASPNSLALPASVLTPGAMESNRGTTPAEVPGATANAPTSSTTVALGAGGVWDDETDPLDRVAAHLSLRDHLRDQVGQAVVEGVRADLVRYLIECVDDRGYLIMDVTEFTEQFRIIRTEAERAVCALQTMDPPGVGARDLRECLLLQAEYLEQTGEGMPLATRILSTCWEDLVSHRDERIASRLRAPLAEIRTALAFLQRSLTPYPGGAFRPEGQSRVAPPSHSVRPDLVFHRTEAGFVVEITRDFEEMLVVAPLWKKLADKSDAAADDSMRRYIRDHVDRAQAFMTGVVRRGRTLRAIARALVACQQGYLETGNRAFLRPLTRQSLAEELELDESVISRAVAEKWAQLPGGEVVPLDAFFGNAHAVREALALLIASEDPTQPYSDDEIADELTAQGFPLARRTVAKYRSLEKILPARLRKRGSSPLLVAKAA